MKDLKYILKRIIIIVLSSILILFFKTNVLAASSCLNTTDKIRIFTSSGYTDYNSSYITRTDKPTSIQPYYTNTSIKNNKGLFSGMYAIRYNSTIPIVSKPTFTVLITGGTTQDITNKCTFSYDLGYEGTEVITTHLVVNFNCNFESTQTGASAIHVRTTTNFTQVEINRLNSYEVELLNDCLILTPNEYDNINSNINNSTNQIINNNNEQTNNINDNINSQADQIKNQNDYIIEQNNTNYAQNEDIKSKLQEIGYNFTTLIDLFDNDSINESKVLSYFNDFENKIINTEGYNAFNDLELILINDVILNLYNNISNGSAEPLYIGTILDTDIILPVMDLESILTPYVFNLIDLFLAFGLLIMFIKKMINMFYDVLSLNNLENYDALNLI